MNINRAIFAFLAGLALSVAAGTSYAHGNYEVWAVDQSDSLDDTPIGGVLYVLSGSDEDFLKGEARLTHKIDLQKAATAAGFSGGSKPHMTLFNTGATHMIIGHAASGHAYAVDAETKAVVDVVTPGKNSHAVIPAPNNKFIIVADIKGKTVHKVLTNYDGGKGNIFGAVTSMGVNGKPICPIIAADSKYAYVTLAGGGLDIVDLGEMRIVHSYSKEEIGPKGCGGIQKGNVVFVNSGNPDPQDVDFVYAFNHAQLPSKPDVYAVPQSGNDSHGMLLAGNYLWVGNRASNTINVHNVRKNPFDAGTDPADRVPLVSVIDLKGTKLGDSAPDLVDISSSGRVVFIAQRGPNPISANNANFNNARGDSPGVGVVKVIGTGKRGVPSAHYSLSHVVGGVEKADIHALRVRK